MTLIIVPPLSLVMVCGDRSMATWLFWEHNGAMSSALDVVTAIGPSVFTVLVPPRAGVEVTDVFVVEPGDPSVGQPGDLVLGLGATVEEVTALVERCAARAASGLVLRVAVAPAAVAPAAERGLLLVALQPAIPWAHVVWMLRGVIDRAAAPDAPLAGDGAVHNDLFVLADTAAAIVHAPVTIEDNQSRVLAYSSGQGLTDTARVSTIVGRRVPPELVAHFRASGVFRRLARSSEPFLVPKGPNGTRPRLVVPVRAGDEWLGSIWAVVDGPVPAAVTTELRNAAAVLALHLLRLRAQADVARRNSVERVRAALRHFTPGSIHDLHLPAPPWRAVALAAPAPETDLQQQVDLWAATLRRYAWAEPVLADVEGTVFAVVTDRTGPGSWSWLRRLVVDGHRDDAALRCAAGSAAPSLADLPRSRAEAAEALGFTGPWRAAIAFDEAWVPLTVRRATAGVDASRIGGPVLRLAEHDQRHGTAYVETLGAWLAYPGEPQRAAAALHVHANTLRHRMKRLADVVELDLTEPQQRLALQLQIESTRVARRTTEGSGKS